MPGRDAPDMPPVRWFIDLTVSILTEHGSYNPRVLQYYDKTWNRWCEVVTVTSDEVEG